MKNKSNLLRAFTLVELMVVISIIALLTGIIMTNFSGSKAKARDAKRVSDIGQIGLALELYFDRCKAYPTSLDVSVHDTCPTGISLSTFIAQLPTDPSTNSPYDYAPKSDGSDYVLHATLESGSAALSNSLNAASAPDWFKTGGSGSTPMYPCYDPNATASLDYCLGSR